MPGTEFGLYFTVDGGKKWVQLKGGMPPTQVRDLQLQKRESDVVMATFGRGFWVLDDYSALREVSAQTMGEEARLFPTRDHAYQLHAVGRGAGRVGRPGDARRQLHDAESADRRGDHLQRGDRRCPTTRSSSPTSSTRRATRCGGSISTRPSVSTAPRGTWPSVAVVAADAAAEPARLAEHRAAVAAPVQLVHRRRAARVLVRPERVALAEPGAALLVLARPGGAQGGRGGAAGAGAAGAAPPDPQLVDQFVVQGGGGRGGGGGGGGLDPGTYRVHIGKLVGETFTAIGPMQTVHGDAAAGAELRALQITEQRHRLFAM